MAIGLKKFFQRTFWVNYTPPAINETHLNNIEAGVTELDNRTVQLDTEKADVNVVNKLVKDVEVDESTGIITITYQDTSTKIIQTNINQIAVNFDFDEETQQIVLTLEDGTKKYIDLSSFITNYEFSNSDTISFSISDNGTVSANVRNGSITQDMLETNYLANIKVEVGKAETASASAEVSDNSAQYEAKLAQSYAVGGSGIREGEDTNNARYYCEKAQEVSAVSEATPDMAGIVKYDNDTIKKNSAGQLYATSSVDVDGTTIQKNDEGIIRVADALKQLIDNAVQQVQGKGLSTNDFTDVLLEKLNGIENGANCTSITNNLLATVEGTALDAVQGKVLSEKCDALNTDLTNLSSIAAKTYYVVLENVPPNTSMNIPLDVSVWNQAALITAMFTNNAFHGTCIVSNAWSYDGYLRGYPETIPVTSDAFEFGKADNDFIYITNKTIYTETIHMRVLIM